MCCWSSGKIFLGIFNSIRLCYFHSECVIVRIQKTSNKILKKKKKFRLKIDKTLLLIQ